MSFAYIDLSFDISRSLLTLVGLFWHLPISSSRTELDSWHLWGAHILHRMCSLYIECVLSTQLTICEGHTSWARSERECVWVWVCVCVRERVSVCVCVHATLHQNVNACVSEWVSVCVCVYTITVHMLLSQCPSIFTIWGHLEMGLLRNFLWRRLFRNLAGALQRTWRRRRRRKGGGGGRGFIRIQC